tara:strand:- start:725 stop:826 length:102 start_codon:yes stop_codon:yes gene_type:complete
MIQTTAVIFTNATLPFGQDNKLIIKNGKIIFYI